MPNEARKLSVVLLLLCLVGCAVGQSKLDWKPCKDFTDQFKAQVEKWNADHKDGFSVELGCTYSGDPHRVPKPKQEVTLTAAEIKHLHALRKIEDAGYDAMTEYENYLFRAHGIRRPVASEPCYYFVGIVVNTDYITVDPNPMMAGGSDCENINWRTK